VEACVGGIYGEGYHRREGVVKQVIKSEEFRSLIALLLERSFHRDLDAFDRSIAAAKIVELKAKVGANGTMLAVIAVRAAVDWLGVNQPSAARIECAHERFRS
jgi:hypothetical protein